VFFRAEDRTDLEDALDVGAGDELLEQLGRLVHERLLAEVRDREEFGAALGAGRDDLRRVDLRTAELAELLADRTHDLRADLEDCLHLVLAQVEGAVVQPCREISVDLAGGIERQFRIGRRDDLERVGRNLDARRRARFLFDRTGDFDDALAGDAQSRLDEVLVHLVFLELDLDLARRISKDQECDAPRSRISWTQPATVASSPGSASAV